MKKKFLLGGIAILSAAILLSGCGSASSTKNEITVGATAGPHAQVVEAAAKEAEKHGLTIHVKEFSDYITPDQALSDGDIDIAVYQHKPFLENFNKQHNTDLVNIGNAILMRMGIYSNNYKNVNDIPDNATVSIPNDPTNEGRGLQLLEQAGLIKLKEGVGIKATPADIVSNPKNLNFKEIEAAQLP
ncbi:MAG: MetQ/NlpA family ABC transporter substrate-binding protein, partial [Dialister micraerophilus]|nr:MetQ/NlpA family ABC transporter substrate-binding protein [Dialister micraerophilus]